MSEPILDIRAYNLHRECSAARATVSERGYQFLEPLAVTLRYWALAIPQAFRELEGWRKRALSISDVEVRSTALFTIDSQIKKRHIEASALYATGRHRCRTPIVKFVVAYLTLADYLDVRIENMARTSVEEYRDMMSPLVAAVDIDRDLEMNSCATEFAYLSALVNTCQRSLASLPSYQTVKPALTELTSDYCDVQAFKQADSEGELLRDWVQQHPRFNHELNWLEFAFSASSPTSVFALIDSAARSQPLVDLSQIVKTYIPWVSALHMALDGFVDQEEDALTGQFAWMDRYKDYGDVEKSLRRLARWAKESARSCPDCGIARLAVSGMAGMYLADPRVKRQGLSPLARGILREGDWLSWFIFSVFSIRSMLRKYKRKPGTADQLTRPYT